MPHLDENRIIKLLKLDNPKLLGPLLQSLVEPYLEAEYSEYGYSEFNPPNFLREVLGPHLQTVSSFNLDPKEWAGWIKSQKGLGLPLNTMHSDMRDLGEKIAEYFQPAIARIIPDELYEGSIKPEAVDKLKGIHSVDIILDENKAPLTIKSKDILYTVFMLGAAARTLLTRDDSEQKIIKDKVGIFNKTYQASLHITQLIDEAMQANPDYRGKSLTDYDLALDVDNIAKSFAKRQQEFCTAYNFLYVASQGKLYSGLQRLKWAVEGKAEPENGIRIETPTEAGAALFGLIVLVEGQSKKLANICQKVATRNPKDAALALQKFMPAFETLLADYERDNKDESNRAAFIKTKVLPCLKEFITKHSLQKGEFANRAFPVISNGLGI